MTRRAGSDKMTRLCAATTAACAAHLGYGGDDVALSCSVMARTRGMSIVNYDDAFRDLLDRPARPDEALAKAWRHGLGLALIMPDVVMSDVWTMVDPALMRGDSWVVAVSAVQLTNTRTRIFVVTMMVT